MYFQVGHHHRHQEDMEVLEGPEVQGRQGRPPVWKHKGKATMCGASKRKTCAV